jgi:hypothetical protein
MLGTINSFHVHFIGVERHKINFTHPPPRGATAQTGPTLPRFEAFRSHKIGQARTQKRARAPAPGVASLNYCQPVAKTATYRTPNKYRRRRCMVLLAKFEVAISAIKRPSDLRLRLHGHWGFAV